MFIGVSYSFQLVNRRKDSRSFPEPYDGQPWNLHGFSIRFTSVTSSLHAPAKYVEE